LSVLTLASAIALVRSGLETTMSYERAQNVHHRPGIRGGFDGQAVVSMQVFLAESSQRVAAHQQPMACFDCAALVQNAHLQNVLVQIQADTARHYTPPVRD
jgi:hypothetical protein